jgi:hypothetical protein
MSPPFEQYHPQVFLSTAFSCPPNIFTHLLYLTA